MTSYLLGIHTSTPTLALAVSDLDDANAWGDRPMRSHHWLLDRQMSSQLHPCLQEFFSADRWPQLVAVAVAVGPGSFTSCRMGVTVARTLGQSLNIPVFGISSLAAIAADYLDIARRDGAAQENRTVAVQMDAKRGEWFAGTYQREGGGVVATVGDRLWTDADWQVASESMTCLTASDWETRPPVGALVNLAAYYYRNGDKPQWSTVLPFYGRKPPIHKG